MRHSLSGAVLVGVLIAGPARAADLRADMREATSSGPGASLGSVTVSETEAGVVFRTDLHGLPPGQRGFHVHENGSCAPGMVNGQQVAAGGAGGHLDPGHTGRHAGPTGHGHLGDLPVLTVAPDGTAKESLTAPNIKDLAVIRGKALVIHAGGDNYSDMPEPLGGGGARIACGIVQ
jgi:Cu-Zn family superoxide dismutase